ncbi:MAG: CRISPR-associated protein Cse2 (CRISPR_cse2) [Syntrophorhabdus sp. PtaB.Bin027]|mgnify:CR=1 FL=1|jgi:CRISPR system Cascade subunit CasB|nr:MAG: CRISPR-associated protein Cse2 (CRISPR_cse2) [Syntrophorhabdus sp. PtaB.Bin027]HPW36055.1 type I-E CRISPR-associated protein Cse2/CasB [Syntrophorhabdus sp.]
MQQPQQYRFLKEETTRERLRSWWTSLDKNRGDRARLCRAERPDDVLLMAPFFRFLHQMPDEWAKAEHILSSAMVAASLSHVRRIQDNETFATQLASPKPGATKPRMSELRFQQLQKSRNPEEFFRRLVRAIRLVEQSVNIVSLAESILHWMNEYRFGADREPQKRIAVRWANDYYKALQKQA